MSAEPIVAAAEERRPSILCVVDQIGGLRNGAAIRQHHLVRAVAQLGDTHVLVLNPAARGHEAELAAELGASVSVCGVTPISKIKAALRMLRHPLLPWRLARADSDRIAEHIAARTDALGAPDLLWVSSLAGWSALPAMLRERSVFDLIDRPTVYHAEQLRTAGRRWLRSRRARKLGTPLHVPPPDLTFVLKSFDGWVRGPLVERWLTRSCRLVVSSNPDELPRRAGDRHRAVANCVASPAHTVPAGGTTLRLLLPAGFKYAPSLDGAEWFLTEVLPEIRNIVGRCHVVLAGSYPPGFEEQARVAGATATGWVPDMAELYRPGTVVIVPLLGGSGTRVKIIEAWSMGVPVVATPHAAKGLGARDGVELFLARTPAEFAVACARLRSTELAAAVANAGRRHYEQHYSADIVTAELQALLAFQFDVRLVEQCSCS